MDANLYGIVITAKNGNEYDKYEGHISSNFLYFKGKLSYEARFFPLRGKTKEVVTYENESASFGDCFLLSRRSPPANSLFNISTRLFKYNSSQFCSQTTTRLLRNTLVLTENQISNQLQNRQQ